MLWRITENGPLVDTSAPPNWLLSHMHTNQLKPQLYYNRMSRASAIISKVKDSWLRRGIVNCFIIGSIQHEKDFYYQPTHCAISIIWLLMVPFRWIPTTYPRNTSCSMERSADQSLSVYSSFKKVKGRMIFACNFYLGNLPLTLVSYPLRSAGHKKQVNNDEIFASIYLSVM